MGPVFRHRANADKFRVEAGRRRSDPVAQSGAAKNGQQILRTGEHLICRRIEGARTAGPSLAGLQKTEPLMEGLRKVTLGIDDVRQRERRKVKDVLENDVPCGGGRAQDATSSRTLANLAGESV